MKRASTLYLVVSLIFSLAWITAAGADPSKEETMLQSAASTLDQEASQSQGEKTVVQQLEKTFNVDEARINSLRDQKLGYGEIAILLSLTQKTPEGITDANIQKILAMRQGPPVMGWGEIAQKLGEKLGPVISHVEKVAKDSHNEIEKAEQGKVREIEKGGKPEKPMKPEKMEKLEKPEKLDTTGKP